MEEGQPYQEGWISPRVYCTWEKPALLPGLARLVESPGLTTFIFRRNPESDICVQVFIL